MHVHAQTLHNMPRQQEGPTGGRMQALAPQSTAGTHYCLRIATWSEGAMGNHVPDCTRDAIGAWHVLAPAAPLQLVSQYVKRAKGGVD